MEIESDQGLYIKGAVSELLLEEFQEGMTINGSSYETGNCFQAKVTDVQIIQKTLLSTAMEIQMCLTIPSLLRWRGMWT